MNTCSLCWHLLTLVGDLPEELIIKILFHFGGLRHPNVSLLLDATRDENCEIMRKLPFSKSIYKFYLNKEKYQHLFGIDIVNYSNNKQYEYYRHYKYNKNYIHYDDPGCFIPRQFGRLYYTILNDDQTVVTTKQIKWKLKTSQNEFKNKIT